MKNLTKEILLSASLLAASVNVMAYQDAPSANATITNDYNVIHAYNDSVPRGSWKINISGVSAGKKAFNLICDNSTTCPTEIKDGQSIQLNMTELSDVQNSLRKAKNAAEPRYDHIEIELTSPQFKDPTNSYYDYCVELITYQVHISDNAEPMAFAIEQMDAFEQYKPNLTFGMMGLDCYKNDNNAAVKKYQITT